MTMIIRLQDLEIKNYQIMPVFMEVQLYKMMISIWLHYYLGKMLNSIDFFINYILLTIMLTKRTILIKFCPNFLNKIITSRMY